MKTIIAYYSFTENNEKLANYLQKQLNCDIVKIETTRKRTGFSILLDLMFNRKPGLKPLPYSLSDYDHVIFIAPIWGGKIAMPMKSLMVKEKLRIRQYSFVTLCGGNAGQKEKIKNELFLILQKQPQTLVELWVNDLLPAEQKNSIKYTSGFRIDERGLENFGAQLKELVRETEIVSI